MSWLMIGSHGLGGVSIHWSRQGSAGTVLVVQISQLLGSLLDTLPIRSRNGTGHSPSVIAPGAKFVFQSANFLGQQILIILCGHFYGWRLS